MDNKGTATIGGNDYTAPYFTAGEGIFSPNVNPDSANSLNSNNYTPEHNQSLMGETALQSHENVQNSGETMQDPNLVPLSMPPGQEQAVEPLPAATSQANRDTISKFNLGAIRTEGDHISRSALKECLSAVSDFYQGGEGPADLCDNARNMMDANLLNSFNRKLGEEK